MIRLKTSGYALSAVAIASLMVAGGAYAGDKQEKCFPRYRATGAVPKTGLMCELDAATADGGMGGYDCPGDPDLIAEYCGGACEVEPLKPITDKDAKEFEQGHTVREDGLTQPMQEKLGCLRDKVAAKGGTFTVNSA